MCYFWFCFWIFFFNQKISNGLLDRWEDLCVMLSPKVCQMKQLHGMFTAAAGRNGPVSKGWMTKMSLLLGFSDFFLCQCALLISRGNSMWHFPDLLNYRTHFNRV